jgi:hypothetical protein
LAVRGRPGRPRKLTGGKLEKLRRLYEAGLTQVAMAKALGVDPSVVRKALRGLGLPTGAADRQACLSGVGGASASASAVEGPNRQNAEEPTPQPREASDDEAGEQGLSVSAPAERHAERAERRAPGGVEHDADETRASAEATAEELLPGAELVAGPAEHPSRYAGTLLLAAAMEVLGVARALAAANVRRANGAIYDAQQMVIALACAWVAGFKSLESMHERDARGLGVVLGLERSPSVRTAHRAIRQMVERFDPAALSFSGALRVIHLASVC